MKFKYEVDITEQERLILEVVERLVGLSPELTLHNLMIGVGVYLDVIKLGKYEVGSGGKHIWISRNNRKHERIAMIVDERSSED